MYLVELFLPIADNDGHRFPESAFARVRGELTDRFGGVTSFSRAPAHGITEESGQTVHDDIIVMEVMTESLDHLWWQNYRNTLAVIFRQDEILIRATETIRL